MYGVAQGHCPPYYTGYPPPPHYRENLAAPHERVGYHSQDPALHPPPRYSQEIEYRPHSLDDGSHPGTYEQSTASPSPPSPPKATTEVPKSEEKPFKPSEASPNKQSDASESEERGVEVPKEIESVAERQASARATGLAPGAFRCVPLKEPIPSSKCRGYVFLPRCCIICLLSFYLTHYVVYSCAELHHLFHQPHQELMWKTFQS